MKSINYQEAYDRLKNGQIVLAVIRNDDNDVDECETERILIVDDLASYAGDDVSFCYDEDAECEAEQIFQGLRDEVKGYLYMLLLSENNPLFA